MTQTERRLPVMLASALAGLLIVAPAQALQEEDFDYDSTRSLYRVCAAEPGVEGHLIAAFACRAFLEATVQYHDAVTDDRAMRQLICYPRGATIADAQAAFVDWARANAENADLMAELPVKGVVRALAAKYPCKER
ncbi:MAG: hypothetical protein EOM91_06700 [Sphingobacteriia bacterium]|nr:hypothetical protein [Sphingobacteriia bacterium]NCC38143.1 hypothetical protein [Gammaproteobacteria bacterium]